MKDTDNKPKHEEPQNPESRGWRQRFEDTMAAATFAEAGMPEVAQGLLRGGKTDSQNVLLVVEGQTIRDRALEYAVSLCRRMNCRLAVLQVLTDEEQGSDPAALEGTLNEITDVPWQVNAFEGSVAQAVTSFLRETRRVISIVMEDPFRDRPNGRRGTSKKPKWLQNLKCPVVLVEGAPKP